MNWRLFLSLAVAVGCSAFPSAAIAKERIVKVLPFLLDRDGLHTRTPNLYDRDAYQLHLRRNPPLQSGMMFAMQIKARPTAERQIRVRLELRGVAKGNFPRQLIVDSYLPLRGGGSRWVYLTLKESEREFLGDVTAWRATLWEETDSREAVPEQLLLLAEQTSFLW